MTGSVRTRSGNGEASPRGLASGPRREGGTGQVVAHVRDLIERGALKPGDRLPAERDLATQIGVSRPTIRAGLRTLAAMGVVRSRHGSGTYIPDGPPALNTDALSLLAALHGFTREAALFRFMTLVLGLLRRSRFLPFERIFGEQPGGRL